MATGFTNRFKGKIAAALAIVNDLQRPVTSGITAHAGGGQASATQLNYGYNVIATVATAADSVKLPPWSYGRAVNVRNAATNAMQLFGTGSDTVNGAASGTGVSQATGSAVYVATSTAGAWVTG